MTPHEEYLTLLRQPPKDLTPDELARVKTTGYPFPSERQMMVIVRAVCRDGMWHPLVLFLHPFGVVGHQVIPQPRQFKADAMSIAEWFVNRIMDVHEQETGVRHRGMFEEEDDDAPCPPTTE